MNELIEALKALPLYHIVGSELILWETNNSKAYVALDDVLQTVSEYMQSLDDDWR